MATRKFEIELSNALLDAETALSKAQAMVGDLFNGYFGKTEPETWALQMYYNNAQIKNSIAVDYLFELGEELKKIRGLLEAAEQQSSKGAEHEQRTN